MDSLNIEGSLKMEVLNHWTGFLYLEICKLVTSGVRLHIQGIFHTDRNSR